jgi:hypothetical protein
MQLNFPVIGCRDNAAADLVCTGLSLSTDAFGQSETRQTMALSIRELLRNRGN